LSEKNLKKELGFIKSEKVNLRNDNTRNIIVKVDNDSNNVSIMFLCSGTSNTCLPYQWPETFNDPYECMVKGYEESFKKQKKLAELKLINAILY
jgi:hypothetical protein